MGISICCPKMEAVSNTQLWQQQILSYMSRPSVMLTCHADALLLTLAEARGRGCTAGKHATEAQVTAA